MLIKKLTVTNKQINIVNQDMDLSEYGVYLVKGCNGSGKTSIIKQIVFGKNEIVFNNKKQEEMYNVQRQQLISYFSQNIMSYKCSVENYICKGRSDIENESIKECLKKLNAEEIDIKMDFSHLSGGEKVKVALATVFLKNTPYIILDEPTNNLDDRTVQAVAQLVEKYSENHTIIIVSHDERLKIKNCKTIKIENDKIVEEYSEDNKINNKNIAYKTSFKIQYLNILFNVLKSKTRLISIFVMLVTLLFGLYLNNTNFLISFSEEEFPKNNVIATYKVDCVYGDINKLYCNEKSIKVDKDDYYKMITYDDINMIAELDGVKKVVLFDSAYYDKVMMSYTQGTMLENFLPISQPQVVSKDFYGLMGYGSSEALITEGKYPSDYKDEVAVSKQVLKDRFNYEDEEVDSAIGKKIKIGSKEYKVVGITELDTCIVSFDKENNYGYYEYDKETFEQFVERNMQFRQNAEYYLSDETEGLYVYVEEGYEEKILDYLISRYPADNYSSDTFSKVWVKAYNTPFLMKCALINIVLSLMLSVVIFEMNKQGIKLQMQKIFDYENYYINSGNIRKLFFVSYLVEIVVLACIIELINWMFASMAYVTYPILMIDLIIVYIPIYIYLLKLSRKKN